MEYPLQRHVQGTSSQRLLGYRLPPDHFYTKSYLGLTAHEFPSKAQHFVQRQSQFIKKISVDLHFSKEVVEDRGQAFLPFREWNAKGLYDTTGIMSSVRSRGEIKIHHPQHKPCHLKNALLSKQIKADTSVEYGKSMWKKPEKLEMKEINECKTNHFVRQEPGSSKEKSLSIDLGFSKETSDCDDETLMKQKKTASVCVVSRQKNEKNMERFNHSSLLTGSAKRINEGRMTEGNDSSSTNQEKSKTSDSQTHEKETETLLPVYYKIPSYLPQPKQEQEIGSNNKTAESLSVKHYELKQSLRLQDLINPQLGKYVHATDNEFEGELYSGTSTVIHQKNEKNIIYTECHNKYKKHLQEILPKPYQNYDFTEEDSGNSLPQLPERGPIRWIALPTSVINETDKCSLPPIAKTSQDRDNGSLKAEDAPLSELQVLRNILTHWMGAWTLSVSWKNATLERLKRDLCSIHSAQKISALVTIASAVLNRPRDESSSKMLEAVSDVPADMLPLIWNALKHEDILVSMAAALCLFFLWKSSEDVRKIFLSVLENGNDADTWAAAQCLALERDYSYLVVKRILTQLFEGGGRDTTKQACYLLRQLSKNTNIIHHMLGDELNNCNWRDRIVACSTIAQLHGSASQDLRNKLNYLMWRDWNVPVRWAAAKALGQMGQGNMVHDQIRRYLEGGNWRAKVEALSLIGWLRYMTAQLLPGFLQCFADDYVNVRQQACLTAGLLQIKDEMVLNSLYNLILNDASWKIQIFAIKALGNIGQVTTRVKEILLRSIRSDVPAVRIEACHCIATLRLCDTDVQSALQDQLVLESNEFVKREVNQTLTAFNIKNEGNQQMRSLIQQEMSRLCQEEVLIPKVLKLDESLEEGPQKTGLLIDKTQMDPKGFIE
ncbi:HEAT repeat-containing 4 [Pelobates cultripes]|uniref:HEAT repeat-containing 4 n=2 Tax=Pelobates cultripes TaxID=61616 RepID=A0AAD1TMW3_PELCU|nr:HEAT repeat-containing 4 [Pelobates cultripes]